MIRPNIISDRIDPIGLIADFEEFFMLTQKCNNSDNKLQVYNPNIGKYLQWISTEVDSIESYPTRSIVSEYSPSSTKASVVPFSNRSFEEKYMDSFKSTIASTKFEDGEYNSADDMFATLLMEDKDATLKMLNEFFINQYDDEKFCVKILCLFNEYSYEELKPFSQTIALASLANKSARVKSAAFNLFAHWGNKEALDLLLSVECPNQPWIKMKYNSVKRSLEEKCCMLAS